MHAKIVTPDIVLSASDVILRPTLGVPQTYGRLPFELKIITFEVTELLCFIPFLDIYQIHITCDFDWAGNCKLINIKVFMIFLPRGVHS